MSSRHEENVPRNEVIDSTHCQDSAVNFVNACLSKCRGATIFQTVLEKNEYRKVPNPQVRAWVEEMFFIMSLTSPELEKARRLVNSLHNQNKYTLFICKLQSRVHEFFCRLLNGEKKEIFDRMLSCAKHKQNVTDALSLILTDLANDDHRKP